MLTSSEQRDKDFMDRNVEALVDTQIRRVGKDRFFPDTLAWRATDAYNLPGKDDASDGRIKAVTFEYVQRRTKRQLQKVTNGLRVYIPIGGQQWQYAAATLAKQVRVFGTNYDEIQQSAGARKDRIDEVLEAHEAHGLTDDDPITVAYEAALGDERVAA